MSTAAQARAAILQRLQSAPTFHPSSADLFADWGNQPGDIVTLRSGDNSYSVPIYGMRTRWVGSTRVEVTATGNKKRAGIAEASKKEYSRRGGGYYGQQFLHREFVSEDGTLRSLLEMTASYLRTEFADDVNGLRSNLEMTASYLRTEFNQSADGLHSEIVQTASYIRATMDADKAGLHSEIVQTASYIRATMDADKAGLHSEIVQTASYWRAALEDTANGLSSRIEQTASYWRANLDDAVNSMHSEVEQTASYWRATLTDEISSLHSEVEQTASSWRASIEGVVGSDGRVTAATIAVAINAQGSSALIAADRVQISGNTTLSGALTVDGDGKLCVSRVMAIGSGYLTTINGDKVTTKDVQINNGGKLIFVGSGTGEHYDIDVSTLKNCIKSASVNAQTNTLTLTPFYGDPITFSKATTLSGTWSGTTLTVTANPALASPLTKTIIHQVEGTGTSIFASHVYKDSASSSSNRLSSVSLYMTEDTSNKKVEVHSGSSSGTVVGSLSTASTYNAGQSAGNAAGQLTGWSEAYQKVAWAGANTSSASMTIKAPAATKASNPNQQSVTYTLSSDNNVAYIKQGAVVVAQLTHNKYSSGYNSGYSNGSPSSAALGSRLSGSTWYITVTKGDGSNSSLACDLANLKSVVGMMYKDSPGSDHQGTLTSGKYVYLGVSSAYNADKTWYVPSSGGGEQHTNSVSMTYDGMQNVSQGGQSIYRFNYHYTRNTASPFFNNKTLWW